MNLTLSQFFTHLINEKNFYAMVANRLKRVMAPGLGTMAVGIQGGRMVLFADPEFVSKVSLSFGIWVVEHELGHVIWDHIPRYLELRSMLPAEGDARERAEATYKIAMDCAVNTLLRHDKFFPAAQEGMRDLCQTKLEAAKAAGLIPPDELLDEKAGLVLPELYELPDDRSFEFYMNELLKHKSDYSKTQLIKTIGIHGLWIDWSSEDGEDSEEGGVKTNEELQGLAQQLRTQLKQVLRGAVNECQKARGTIPSECREWLENFLAPPIVSWWSLLTTRVQATKRAKYERGISRPNRPLMAMAEEDASIIPALGLERDPRYRIFFMVDTSGSMDIASLQIAASELTHLLNADEDMEVRYIQGDADVHFDQVFHSGDALPAEVTGRGGTDFDAYFTHMAQYTADDETCPDLVIVYTDGWAPAVAPENRLAPEIPVIWLLTPHGTPPENYGEVIVCDASQNGLYEKAQ